MTIDVIENHCTECNECESECLCNSSEEGLAPAPIGEFEAQLIEQARISVDQYNELREAQKRNRNCIHESLTRLHALAALMESYGLEPVKIPIVYPEQR